MAKEKVDLRRRRLMQALGGSLLAPLIPTARSSARDSAELELGVVVARSAHYPQMATDFLTGLHLGLAQVGGPVINLQVSHYDGNRPASGLAMARNMAEQEDLFMLTGIADPDSAITLHDTLTENKRPFLVCDAGANISRCIAPGRYLPHQSLGYSQSNQAAGTWAAQHLGPRAVLAMGFRESGYDLPHSFRHGYEAAGGVIAAQHVSFNRDGRNSFDGLADQVRRFRPDFVHALYSGKEARDFATYYRQAGLAAVAPLLGGGFLVEGGAGNGAGSPQLTAASWSNEQAQCTSFGTSCRRAGVEMAPYTMLGYEAALRIGAALALAGSAGKALADALATVTVEGPRGEITGQAGAANQSHWLRQGVEGRIVAALPPTGAPPLQAGMTSGWLYPYLAA